MSSNKTQNYQLHSWLPQDEFHLTEINENFSLLDAALKAEAGSAAQKQTALETALNSRVRMVAGSYVGQGQTMTRINLGFKPKAVVIMNTRMSITNTNLYFLAVESGYANGAAKLTATGFTATNTDNGFVYVNSDGSTYHYVAFY